MAKHTEQWISLLGRVGTDEYSHLSVSSRLMHSSAEESSRRQKELQAILRQVIVPSALLTLEV